jgi:hypothetical protein
MAKSVQIVKSAVLKTAASKEQKRFNAHLATIKKLKIQIETAKERALELGKIGSEKIRPAQKKMFDALKKFLLYFEESPHQNVLKKKQREKYINILLELSGLYLSFDSADERMKAIYDAHAPTEFENEKVETIEFAKQTLVDILNAQLGTDFTIDDIENLDDPFSNPKVIEKIAAFKEREKNAAKQPDTKQKGKTEKQIAKENQKKAAEKVVSKTTKQIYLDLVKNFHPDTELDEARKQEKTEIMQQITAAYHDDDYIKLLELQMSLLQDRENAVLNFTEPQLKHLNDALKNQISELEGTLYSTVPSAVNGFPYGQFFDFNVNFMHHKVNSFLNDCKAEGQRFMEWRKLVESKQGFQELVKSFEFEEEEDFDFIDAESLQLLQMMLKNQK